MPIHKTAKSLLGAQDIIASPEPVGNKSYLSRFEELSDYDAAMQNYQAAVIQYGDENYFQGQGPRKNDYLTGWESEQGPRDIYELKAQTQTGWDKAGKGVTRMLTETAINILQIPGYAGGAIAAAFNEIFSDGEGSMDIMMNNWWTDALEGAKEHFTNEIAPVYVKRAVRDGNLWANITSVDFWATEGASGLAFLLSAFAPGAAIRGFGVGIKLANALGKSKKLIDGIKVLEKADKISKTIGLGNLENAITIVGATISNTLYEAAVEADGAKIAYEQLLVSKLESGEISEKQYLSLIANGSQQAAKVFKDNLAILLLPNLFMSKILFGKAIPGKQLNRFKVSGGKITAELEKEIGRKGKAIALGKTVGKAIASEAFLEEGGQMASEKYHSEQYISKMVGQGGKSMAETYFEMLGTTEGQKAMFLGGLFGSGAVMIGNIRQKGANIKQHEKLAEIMTNGVNFFEAGIDGIHKKDKEGNIIYESGEAVIDKQKIADLGENLDYIKSVELEKEKYEVLAEMGIPGAQEKVELLNQNIINNMLFSFIHAGEEGTALLKNYLENSEGLKTLVKTQNANKSIKKTEKETINALVNEAEALRKDYEWYSKYGEFKNELWTNKKDDPYYIKYSNLIKNKYAASKSTSRFLVTKTKELEDALAEVTNDALERYKKRKIQKDDYVPGGAIIENLKKRIEILSSLAGDVNNEIEAIGDVTKQKTAYNKFKKAEIVKEAAEEESKELDDLLGQLSDTNTEEELKAVIIPEKFNKASSAAQKAIERAKDKKKKEFLNHKKEQEAVEKTASELSEEEKQQVIADKQVKVDYITNNYAVGEIVPLTGLDVEGVKGAATLKEITPEGMIVTDEEGTDHIIDIDTFYDEIYDPEQQFNTDGGPKPGVSPIISTNKINSKTVKKDARIAITNNEKEGVITLIANKKEFKDAYDIETTPSDKKGYYGIEFNKQYTAKNNKAVALFKKEGVTTTNIDYLIANLPLSIKLSDIVSAPLENQTEGDQTVFNETTKVLKKTILEELMNGTDIADIQIEIVGQYSGVLQIAKNIGEGIVAENNIVELHEFQGNIDNINHDNFYIVNDLDKLENAKGDTDVNQYRDLAKGEVYLKIKRANGKPFPLKLNVKKINEAEADLLYDLYKARFKDFADGKLKVEEGEEIDLIGKGALIKDVAPQVIDKLKTEFPEIWAMFTEGQKFEDDVINDLTIKDVLDFFIWDGTSSPKSRVRFNKGLLQTGESTFTQEEFDNGKEGFIAKITDMKRHHIKFKKHKGDSFNLSMTNPNYVNYLLKTGKLNTNAVVNEPTFQHRTTMYTKTNSVKVKGKLSKYNVVLEIKYRDNLLGSNKDLKQKLPRIFALKLELNKEPIVLSNGKVIPKETKYVDQHGNIFNRMSELKDIKFTDTEASIAGIKRGNVSDKLIRDFFAPGNELTDKEFFRVRGYQYLDTENKLRTANTLLIGDDWFNALFDIYSDYKELFDEKGYTVYSDVPTLPMKLGDKGEYAGTVDLLLYDNNDKSWIIVDLKTSSVDREQSYNVTNDFHYKTKDAIQQNGYIEAFKQTTGQDATAKILPITTKSDNKEDKNSYLVAIPYKTKVDFLDISTEKDIYELTGNKATTARINTDEYVGDTTISEIEEDSAEEMGGGTAFDAYMPENNPVVAKVTPKVTPKVVSTKIEGLTTKQKKFAAEQLKGSLSLQLVVDGVNYAITPPIVEDGKIVDGLYVINFDDPSNAWNISEVVYVAVIEARNTLIEAKAFDGIKIKVETARKTWNSRFNFVSLQKTAPKVTVKQQKIAKIKAVKNSIDTSKLTPEQATNGLKVLMAKRHINIGNMKAIYRLREGLSAQEQLKVTLEYLIDKGVNKEEILKDCKL